MKLIGKASEICNAVVKFMLVRNVVSCYKNIREQLAVVAAMLLLRLLQVILR